MTKVRTRNICIHLHNNAQRSLLFESRPTALRLQLMHLVGLYCQIRVAILLNKPLWQRLSPIDWRRFSFGPRVVLVVRPQSVGSPICLAHQNIFDGVQIAWIALEARTVVVVTFPLQAIHRVAMDKVLVESGLDGFAIAVLFFVYEARPELWTTID